MAPDEALSLYAGRHQRSSVPTSQCVARQMRYRGRLARFVCPIDVTQRLQAERALREGEAGLRRAQAMARLGHVITRADGSFESWSETLPGLAGVAAGDMPRSVQEWLRRLVHPEDRELFRRKSSEAAATVTRVDVEYRMPRADGGMTFMKQAIANRELALAKAAADHASRSKSEFLSNMSHELRTPLNAILGFAQLLASSDQRLNPDRQAAFVEHIVSAGQHLLTLINELLDLAHVESGTLAVAMEWVSLAEVLRDCLGLIEPLAFSRQIRIEADSRQATRVMADRVRLKQVLLNLLSNAVKYNREGGLVRVECARQPAGRVRISVCDTGAGLLPTQVDTLFRPFNRLGQEAAGSEGSGLGWS